MTITGKYERDSNFTTVYMDDAMYTIARKTGEWGCLKIGDTSATGHVLTQKRFEELNSSCEKEGTFNLK